MQLYRPALKILRSLPEQTHAGFLMRHSTRFPILSEDDVYSAGLTGEGITQAERFGNALAAIRKPGRLHSSPVGRCLDTAQAIARGSGWDLPVQSDYRLSHPFIERVWSGPVVQWKKDPLPDALRAILDLIIQGDEKDGGLDVFITHDTVVAALAGYFTGMSFHYPDYWPDFMEGIMIWRCAGRVHLKWRELETMLEPWPLPETGQMALGL